MNRLTFIFALPVLMAAQDSGSKPLSTDQREKQLSTRVSPGLLGNSTFDSFASAAYALHYVVLTCKDEKVIRERLSNPFPEFYKPTWREILETLARQLRTTWSYSEKEACWLFAKPALPRPFKIDLAKGWKEEDCGFFISFQPPDAEVGMDVFYLGTYSFEKDSEKELLKARDHWALQFLKEINPKARIDDMKKVSIDGGEALHFETGAPREGVMWRQWVFARNGGVYGIVSALDKDRKALLKDVQGMVASFKFTSPTKQ